MNYVKRGWKKTKDLLNEIEDIFSLEETINLLQTKYYYEDYFGRAKNRTLLKENPKLYKSIYYHSEVLESKLKEQKTYKGKYNFKYRMKFLVEKNADIENLKCECGNKYNWTKYCRKCPEPKKTWEGRKYTKKTRQKQRVSTLSYLNTLNGKLAPRYNKNSIPLLEKKANDLGIDDLQHAENGGEYHIEELGYFVDGYSKKHNIVIEVDEKHHFNNKGILRKKDRDRQREIENFLNCKFYRIRYNE